MSHPGSNLNHVKGWQAHGEAVDRLLASYGRIAPGDRVRLAKKTSNLFRPRQGNDSPGLDVSGLDGVIAIDIDAQTADVQGICTYEQLVAETLVYGFMPYVVPQLRTITLGGAVTGLGIESTSFRSGLPHESVLEMDILTGSGEIVTAAPEGDHADLFDAFPNSYGSLGYATRLKIKLEKVPPFVTLRHVQVADAAAAVKAIEVIAETGEWHGERVDGLDGTAFSPDEIYLTLAHFTDTPQTVSDYTGQQIYYRSIQTRETDALTINDYIWRWDTDWFWCSGAFGAQNRWVRKVWPTKWRRSDVYHRLVGLDEKIGLSKVLDRIKQGAGTRARDPGRRGAGRPAPGVPRVVRRRGRHAPGVAVPVAYDPRRGRSTRSRPERHTSMPGSGARSRSPPAVPTAWSTGGSRTSCTISAATSPSTPRRSTTRRHSSRCMAARCSPPPAGDTTPRAD